MKSISVYALALSVFYLFFHSFFVHAGSDAQAAMSCAKTPSVGFTLGAFDRHGWDQCEKQIEILHRQHFRFVVLSIAYKVEGDTADQFTIKTSDVPTSEDTARCIEAATRRGMQVMLKPHLDGGWRGGYDFDPARSWYYSRVIARELEAIRIAQSRLQCRNCRFGLTFGTELSKSENRYPESWEQLVQEARLYLKATGLEKQVHLSHDFMFDVDRTAGAKNLSLGRFVAALDSVSVSQYTPLNVHGATATGVQQALAEYESKLRSYLQSILPPGAPVPPINFGEFAIGSDGLAKPWVYGGPRKEEETQIGFQGLLAYLNSRPGPKHARMQFVSLWTIGDVFDVLGNFYGKRSPAADGLEAYNRGVCPGFAF